MEINTGFAVSAEQNGMFRSKAISEKNTYVPDVCFLKEIIPGIKTKVETATSNEPAAVNGEMTYPF